MKQTPSALEVVLEEFNLDIETWSVITVDNVSELLRARIHEVYNKLSPQMDSSVGAHLAFKLHLYYEACGELEELRKAVAGGPPKKVIAVDELLGSWAVWAWDNQLGDVPASEVAPEVYLRDYLDSSWYVDEVTARTFLRKFYSPTMVEEKLDDLWDVLHRD